MVTQALMWENIKINETDNNWYHIDMEDGYDGWIHSFYIQHEYSLQTKNIFVTKRAVPVFYEKKDDVSSPCLYHHIFV